MSLGLLRIRDLDPAASSEIDLVADRMRQTLVEVLGQERGDAMYTVEWLRERVRFHLEPGARLARVLLAETGGEVVGHAIARLESADGALYGHFSTIFVAPEQRGRGVAAALIGEVERWMTGLGVPRIAYDTGAHHARVIALFERRGYRITLRDGEMVRLVREIGPSARLV